ncbi:SDR family NAD(P)-dependent oxidoreductase [Rhodovastum atsumiense]|uniref:SDR family NAD(P)-dependent oxidoreductase n=1 Tax=Rhodovastum atsumiense TaxID=504468 RepID=A0A5M6J0L2_9PROT|nr:SDR family NAD(P)-dependent oxidoreductase [Rhodovastum atsumiense]KAA5614130.1 SDR family NAD(P)-dependent oxidoreductase [Rhodovastum atsumiense]CAH2598979.1 SDR family NAD(P)-dependent oxidoreductase [Rhodovastum atsumiense]
MRLEGMAAIVTGGASGLGAATADLLAARGARVSVFDRDVERGEAQARATGGLFQPLDVTDPVAAEAALAAAEAAHGVARILVNCAGIGTPQRAIGRDGQPQPLETFRRVIEVNLIGSFNILSKFAARLAAAEPVGEERGVAINTASIAAYDGQIGQAAYSASKGGVVGMTLPLARELAQHRIRVVTVAPGLFLTPLLSVLPPAAQESLGQQVPFPPRLGDPAEYADLVACIIGNPMLNGETIRIDGALRMAPR